MTGRVIWSGGFLLGERKKNDVEFEEDFVVKRGKAYASSGRALAALTKFPMSPSARRLAPAGAFCCLPAGIPATPKNIASQEYFRV